MDHHDFTLDYRNVGEDATLEVEDGVWENMMHPRLNAVHQAIASEVTENQAQERVLYFAATDRQSRASYAFQLRIRRRIAGAGIEKVFEQGWVQFSDHRNLLIGDVVRVRFSTRPYRLFLTVLGGSWRFHHRRKLRSALPAAGARQQPWGSGPKIGPERGLLANFLNLHSMHGFAPHQQELGTVVLFMATIPLVELFFHMIETCARSLSKISSPRMSHIATPPLPSNVDDLLNSMYQESANEPPSSTRAIELCDNATSSGSLACLPGKKSEPIARESTKNTVYWDPDAGRSVSIASIGVGATSSSMALTTELPYTGQSIFFNGPLLDDNVTRGTRSVAGSGAAARGERARGCGHIQQNKTQRGGQLHVVLHSDSQSGQLPSRLS